VSCDEWPGVTDAVAALTDAFGNAYVKYTGGGCYAIFVPI
jgi:hypothetical protein